MKSINFAAVFFVIGSIPLQNAISQNDSTEIRPTRVTLRDGSELIGTIIDQDSASVQFRTSGGISMTIPHTEIQSKARLSGTVTGGTYVRWDPNNTRLFFAPTARPLLSGQGYFSAYQIFFPFVAFGIGNYAILAGGMSLFPGASSQLVYFAPKIIPIQTEKLDVAAGMLYISATSGNADGAGIYYGVVSYGNQSASLTGGLGWGLSGDETADKPILLLGAEYRLSNSTKFITENWIIPDSDADIISFGLRFFGDNVAADLGLIRITSLETDGFPFIPWLGFAYNFGTTR
ncbi:MAG: hypothetical protein HYV29_02065 [Ignavibacteriales bacterium]|nr:hypothetical protein [Ignavibacteriales bacterium]